MFLHSNLQNFQLGGAVPSSKPLQAPTRNTIEPEKKTKKLATEDYEEITKEDATPRGADSKCAIHDPLQRALSVVNQTLYRGSRKITGSAVPPKLNATPTHTMTMRYFKNDNSVSVNSISGNTLAGALGCVVYVANATARAIHGTARIKQVKVWPSMISSLALGSVIDIRWGAGVVSTIQRDVDYVENMPGGTTISREMTFKPPKNSVAGDWMNLGVIGTGVLFTIEASGGTILDLTVECTLSNNVTGATITLGGVTVAIGVFGYTSLEGSGGTAGIWQPVGIASVL